MSRGTEPTAGAPGVQPGARGGAVRGSVSHPHAHRPVLAPEPSAGPGPAARSNRGDKARAAGAGTATELAPAAPEREPLDLHEGICDPLSGKCQRWPEELRLLNHETGELVPGRCKATNLCRYCQMLYVVETVEMLTLDAMEYAPTLWLVLTAREHLTRQDTYAHLRQVRKTTRKIWPDVEWFVQVEFQQRGALHLNLLLKGAPVEAEDRVADVIFGRWCQRANAERAGQWIGVVQDGVGVTRYISKMLAHGLKAEQAPPIGWKGHRTSQTRGYLVRPASVMRHEARRSLRIKRQIYRGMDAEAAELEVAASELTTWELRHVRPSTMPLRARRALQLGDGEWKAPGRAP